MKELICIVCPRGCHLQVDEQDYTVTGNFCPRGAQYGSMELKNPMRTLTGTVKLVGSTARRCPVKTEGAIPKSKMLEAVKALDDITAAAPIKAGDVLADNFCETGIRLIATKSFDA